jgi:flagellar biosynthesis protein FlhB
LKVEQEFRRIQNRTEQKSAKKIKKQGKKGKKRKQREITIDFESINQKCWKVWSLLSEKGVLIPLEIEL